ncbi:hypothetical protein H0H93_011149 [Arthromyces matolae]|nr:hypothetical protein H0H93_011149 [Arthromyces matolae]
MHAPKLEQAPLNSFSVPPVQYIAPPVLQAPPQMSPASHIPWFYPPQYNRGPFNDPRMEYLHALDHTHRHYYPVPYTSPYVVGYPAPQTAPPSQPVVPPVLAEAPQKKTHNSESESSDSNSESDSSSDSHSSEDQDNDFNYPNGNAEREVCAGTIEASTNSWKATQWVWRSCGFVNAEVADGTVRKVELRKCRGVLKCPNCDRLTRPGTNTRKRDNQKLSPCYRCGVFPVEVPCTVKSLHFPLLRDGIRYLRWEQQGRHTHKRPPLSGHLTQEQMVEIDKQVLRRPDATPHQHRVGDTHYT